MKKGATIEDSGFDTQARSITMGGRSRIRSGYPTKSEIARTLSAAVCRSDLEVEGFEIDRRGRIKVFLKAIVFKPESPFEEWRLQREMRRKHKSDTIVK